MKWDWKLGQTTIYKQLLQRHLSCVCRQPEINPLSQTLMALIGNLLVAFKRNYGESRIEDVLKYNLILLKVVFVRNKSFLSALTPHSIFKLDQFSLHSDVFFIFEPLLVSFLNTVNKIGYLANWLLSK